VVLIELSRPDEETEVMADELRMALETLLRKAQMEHDADFLRVLSEALMELDVTQYVGAERPGPRGEGRDVMGSAARDVEGLARPFASCEHCSTIPRVSSERSQAWQSERTEAPIWRPRGHVW